jgi:predicted nucleic acid-binding protein
MENNIYFDTNIFIDLMDFTRPYALGSMALSRTYIAEGKIVHINSDTITNAFYVMSRTKAYSPKELLVLFKKMVSLFEVVAIEEKEVMMALSLCEDEGTAFKDYEDALQYVCAKKVGAELIVTNDKGFVGLDIEVRGTE